MIVLLTNYLLVTSLITCYIVTMLQGATIGSSPAPDTSLHMVAISVFYSHTNISLIILIIVTTLVHFHSPVDMSGRLLTSDITLLKASLISGS